jgi:hypothetical protein
VECAIRFGEASSTAPDATVVRQSQKEKSICYVVRGVNSSTFAPNGGNFCLISSCRRSSHCSVGRRWSRGRARPSCCSACRRPSRRLPPRRGCPARSRCLIRSARPRRLGEWLDVSPPGPPSLTAPDVTPPRPEPPSAAPPPPWLPPSPSPAAVAPESPPLGVARHRYGLDKKTHGREGRGKKKRKEKKRKGNKEKKKGKETKKREEGKKENELYFH